MTTLIHETLWSEIKAHARKTKRRSFVAVAYLNTGAFDRLPLRPGSLLIVNCNLATVQGGQTDPREVKKYLDSGVLVHNVSNLHAKVFVIGTRAFIGSANVSKTSERLFEVAIMTTDRELVAAGKELVRSLTGEQITPSELDKLIPKFNPGRGLAAKDRRIKNRHRRMVIPEHNPFWAIRTIDGTWDESDEKAAEDSQDAAEENLTSDNFKIEKFKWSGRSAFFRDVRKGDRIMQVYEESPRKLWLEPPQTVISVRSYKHGKRKMICVEQKRRLRDKRLSDVSVKLPAVAKFLRSIDTARIVRDAKTVHATANLWGLD